MNNTEAGFAFNFIPEERFARSISFLGDLRGDGTIAVNYGGGAGAGSAGALNLLFFKPCEFIQEPGFNHWNGGTTLFSNWNHQTQMLTSDSLTFEQCTFKAFETDAAYMTYNFNDGRCIFKDSTAALTVSTEFSNAYTNSCFSNYIATSTNDIYANDAIKLFPNPTTSEIFITSDKIIFGTSDEASIYDITGKLLQSITLTGTKAQLDIANQPSGLYFIQTNIQGSKHVFKVVKE